MDANALLILVLGRMNPGLFARHKRTSAYEEVDYFALEAVIEAGAGLMTLPNVWTVVDNLLNNFRGGYRDRYIATVLTSVTVIEETYLPTQTIAEVAEHRRLYYDLGVTDTHLLRVARNHEMLITMDSRLSDYAKAWGITVYDIVAERNRRLR